VSEFTAPHSDAIHPIRDLEYLFVPSLRVSCEHIVDLGKHPRFRRPAFTGQPPAGAMPSGVAGGPLVEALSNLRPGLAEGCCGR